MCARSALIFSLLTFSAGAQTPAAAPKPAPDVLTFKNGEKLVGQFIGSHGTTITFKSDSVGQVNVDWSKVQDLQTSQTYAVLDKGVKLNRHSDLTKVPQGRIAEADQKVTIVPASGASISVPLDQTAHIVDEPTFEKNVLHEPGLLENWTGVLNGGASLVEATQSSRTFTGAVHFVRGVPSQNWMDPRNRTLIDFTASNGVVTQPNTPTLKTNIIHGDVERDQYFTGSHAFAFGQAVYDHNFSQGLDLQQTYAGGIGWTVVKRANTSLDLKASISFTRQQFSEATETPFLSSDHNLFGSVFSENYAHKFGKGIQFLQQISATPAWNELNAYAAQGSASLNVPVYKKLGFSFGISDSFVNDPPPGFKKNSFQLTTALSYTLK